MDNVTIESLVHSSDPEALLKAAADPRLTQDLALSLLVRRELTAQALEALSRSAVVLKHRPVLNALVAHAKTPRYISLPIIRRLFTFELMKLALTPTVAADVKLAADEAIINRLGTVSSGERLSLAKQGSTRIAASLLLDPEQRIVEAALSNPRTTESEIVKALKRDRAPQHLFIAICTHEKWRLRTEIQQAVLQAGQTPLEHAIAIADLVSGSTAREVLRNPRLREQLKNYLEQKLARIDQEVES